jgi:hypothetical protein
MSNTTDTDEEDLRALVTAAVYRLGVRAVAEVLGLSNESVLRIMTDQNVRSATRQLAELRAAALREAGGK